MTMAAGERLREAREGKGLTVEDVAARLRIPARYVRALEQGDLAALPEPTFVRGYVKAYARELGLDGDALVAELVPAVEVKAPRPLLAVDGGSSARKATAARAPNFRAGASSRRRLGWLVAAVVALAVAGVLVVALISSGPGTPTSAVEVAIAPPAAPGAPAPVVSVAGEAVVTPISLPAPAAGAASDPAAATAPALAGGTTAVALPLPATSPATTPVTAPATAAATAATLPAPAAVKEPVVPRRGLYLRFLGDSWVEVRDADNLVLHTSTQPAGSVLSLDGKAPLTVTLGDSAQAELWYNGVRQPNRGGSARVSRIIVGQAAR